MSGFQFSVNHDFKPTTITVNETGEPTGNFNLIRIRVSTWHGSVNNPIGVTNITDLHGDIFDEVPTGSMRRASSGQSITDSFAISAPKVASATTAAPLQLEVVDSDDGPTDPAEQFRTVDAGNDVYLEIQGLYREGPAGRTTQRLHHRDRPDFRRRRRERDPRRPGDRDDGHPICL